MTYYISFFTCSTVFFQMHSLFFLYNHFHISSVLLGFSFPWTWRTALSLHHSCFFYLLRNITIQTFICWLPDSYVPCKNSHHRITKQLSNFVLKWTSLQWRSQTVTYTIKEYFFLFLRISAFPWKDLCDENMLTRI